jgi:hypothetical protein
MKSMARRALIGLLCGIISSFFLCFTLGSVGLGPALGALLGIAQTFAFFELGSASAIDRAMTAAAQFRSCGKRTRVQNPFGCDAYPKPGNRCL